MSKVSVDTLLTYLIAISRKSGEIARIIRKEKKLFDILIQEKASNEYVSVDYKTFGDVLIQETARFDLNKFHRDFGKCLFGEESNEFTNKLDKKIEIKFNNDFNHTKQLILNVLDSNESLAVNLAKLIHDNVENYYLDLIKCDSDKLKKIVVSTDDVELWIDPIDGTKQYVNGVGLEDSLQLGNTHTSSLFNVTVLIGAYYKSSGIPFVGVICQPFYNYRAGDNKWIESIYWGVSLGVDCNITSDSVHLRYPFQKPGNIVSSQLDCEILQSQLLKFQADWNISVASSAGFKFLQILSGVADFYILTKDSTYQWDICGPHAILLACGGGICRYDQLLSKLSSGPINMLTVKQAIEETQVTYCSDISSACNKGGILAYSCMDAVLSVIEDIVIIDH